MEEDRLQADLGIAADIEEAQLMTQLTDATPINSGTDTATSTGNTPMKQPKKRFIGRRAAAEAAATATGTGGSGTEGESRAVTSTYCEIRAKARMRKPPRYEMMISFALSLTHRFCSDETSKGTSTIESSTKGDHRGP